jgi:hypothetical protein
MGLRVRMPSRERRKKAKTDGGQYTNSISGKPVACRMKMRAR